MAKSNKVAKNNKVTSSAFFKNEKFHVALGVILMIITIYLFLALFSFFIFGEEDVSILVSENVTEDEIKNLHNWTAFYGAKIAYFLVNKCFGVSAILIVLPLGAISLYFMKNAFKVWKWILYPIIGLLFCPVAFHFFLSSFFDNTFLNIGGLYGQFVTDFLSQRIGKVGVFLSLLTIFVLVFIFTFKSSIDSIQNTFSKNFILFKGIKGFFSFFGKKMKKKNKDKDRGKDVDIDNDKENAVRIGPNIIQEEWLDGVENNASTDNNEKNTSEVEPDDSEDIGISVVTVPITDDDVLDQKKTEKDDVKIEVTPSDNGETLDNVLENYTPYDPTLDLSMYKYPTLDLLKDYPNSNNTVSIEEQKENQRKIIETLGFFDIKIKKIIETIGPTVTLYEIVPEDGVRINKIKNLEDDIMLRLSAIGIRIIAPMPGRGTIGIEVPNSKPRVVSMLSTIASKKFQEMDAELPVAIGRTISNEVFTFDLTKMPHLLVAGATGQGKSVGLNAIITSLLYKKHPSQLKLVLIDPKKVEFSIFSEIEKHFLAKIPDSDEAVITDTSKVIDTLNSLCKEMDDRYLLLKSAKARNIKEYNGKFIERKLNPNNGHKFLPYIVVIIDEFCDLIMSAGKQVEFPIARIAQLARAVGIHMIVATQRPSVNVITGTIKANFPARIAFKVTSGVDSKTILDTSGAQQLIGKGDMLISTGSSLTRVQCAFVDTPEVENIVNFIAQQQSYPSAFELPEPDVKEDDSNKTVDLRKRDVMFDEIARYVVRNQQGSTSNIQRNFEIGFNRAGKIMDQLEAAGIVGPVRGSKPREVIIKDEMELDRLLTSL